MKLSIFYRFFDHGTFSPSLSRPHQLALLLSLEPSVNIQTWTVEFHQLTWHGKVT